ncbi:ROK family transcriptional regulator [Fictibacillus sp. Mic-4]|uniref:ROK family transcriptional regulator n=1 Tax=Fictibacillus sp. Mic-4 TaxID=3132826 RepID=UPI003CF4C00A
MLRGSFQLMKSLNRSMILNKIRLEGPISRAQIAKDTKLTPPTVSSIVKELIEAGLVLESAQGESNGGRKPTMLVIHAKNFNIIGLDVGPKHIRTVLTDLNGQVLAANKNAISLPITEEKLLSLMKKEIEYMLDSHVPNLDKMIGIGVGMHGVVDVHKGISLFATNLQLREIPIKEELERHFNMIVKVENDARTMALGEAWFGNGNGINTLVAVNVGNGIGAGMVVDGKLYHGVHSIAGEIGHMTIAIGGKRCSCGNDGCLQTLAAGPAIAELMEEELKAGKESLLSGFEQTNREIDAELVHQAALQGDELSIRVLEKAGTYLGIGLTNLIHTANPERIIIGGGVSKAGDFILKSVKETIQKRALTDSAKQTEIMLSKLGDNATAIGAASLLLVELFSPETLD